MKTWKTIIALGLAVNAAVPARELRAAKVHPKAGSTAAPFLKMGVAARASAMGEAFSALSDDMSAVHWNPAGLGRLAQKEVSVMDNESVEDIRFAFLGYAHPLGGGRALGVSAAGLFVKSDLERRSGLNESVSESPLTSSEGNFGAHDYAAAVSYAWPFNGAVGAGLSLKFIQQSIDDASAQTTALDLGLLGRIPTEKPASWAAVLQNFGPGLKFVNRSYNLPLALRLGASYKPADKWTLTADLRQPTDNYTSLHLGAEFDALRFFTLRGGYKYRLYGNELGELSGVTLGMGLKLGGGSVDYSFNPAGDLGTSHKFSLGYRFGGPGVFSARPAASTESAAEGEEIVVEEEAGGSPFRLRIKSVSAEPPLIDVVAEAAKSAEVYRLNFKAAVAPSQELTFTSLETDELSADGAPAIDGAELYKLVSFNHNFGVALTKIGMVFRVKKSWLKDKGLDPNQIFLARIHERGAAYQPTRSISENGEYVSYRADADQEGTYAILAKTGR